MLLSSFHWRRRQGCGVCLPFLRLLGALFAPLRFTACAARFYVCCRGVAVCTAGGQGITIRASICYASPAAGLSILSLVLAFLLLFFAVLRCAACMAASSPFFAALLFAGLPSFLPCQTNGRDMALRFRTSPPFAVATCGAAHATERAFSRLYRTFTFINLCLASLWTDMPPSVSLRARRCLRGTQARRQH